MSGQNKNKKKSKLTLNTIGLVLLVVIVAAFIYVWKDNNAGRLTAAAMTANITTVQQQIKAISSPASDLQSQLDTLTAKLAAARSGFPATVDGNDVIAYILDTANETQVDVLPLASGGWATENIGQAYRVLSLTASAEGSLKDIKNFITALQTGRFPTLTIPDCTVNRVLQTALEAPGDDIDVSVNMKICIYTVITPAGKDAA